MDLEKYSGVWYEIASIKGYFQKGLTNTTCTFTPTEEGFTVGNYGINAKGERSGITGILVPDKTDKAKMKFTVSVMGGLINPTSNWWIILMEDTGAYHVVSNDKATTCWILSRTPTLDDTVYDDIIKKLQNEFGMDTTNVEKTPQNTN
eukprot:TRINITY_DN18930_c0_g1_i1.p1 TRINITY_DN18930_c0_g1~~TRINITY_DN18930_c0_g1_i1.p1  ORF type:complete len:159 (+),score=33.68 TRINITY_DN18930_c0_g1_i1:35-478(+)